MKFLKAAPTVLSMALLGFAVSSARADNWDKKTTITFSGPVEIPGVHLQGFGILPAGTYVFRVLDSRSDRHIVQIFSKDELTIYATILAIPNLRLKATDKTVMTFRERPAGQPEALRAWFYPGKEWGEEFVYPKARAITLAQETHTAVLSTSADITPEVTEAVKTPNEPVVVALEQAPISAVQPSGEEVEIAQAVTPVPLVAQETPAAETLPATASSLPLMALFGMLALAGALMLGLFKKRAL
ncbi:MAG: LPXTG cell wall anchor domain-containing protein [Acidobacteriota bacterium]|nr:LPXTG cell wall anchor domain-containing protein [Acidobacteriota bacterium]